MKKIIGFALSFMIFFGALGVHADTAAKTATLSLDNMETLVTTYNRDLAAQKNSITKAAIDMNTAYTNLNNINIEMSFFDVKTYVGKLQYDAMSPQQTAYHNAYYSQKYYYETLSSSYNQGIKSLTVQMKQQYLSYLDALNQEKIKKTALDNKQKELQSNKTRLEKGFISKKQYDKLAKSLKTEQEAYDKATKASSDLLKKIKDQINIPATVTVALDTTVKFDQELIPQIKYETDLKQMMSSSLELKNKKLDYDTKFMASPSNTYDIKNAEIALTTAKEKAESDFKAQYEKLQDSYKSYKEHLTNYEEKKHDLEIAETKWNLGFVSTKARNDLKSEVESDGYQLESEKNSLYVLYMTYQNTKSGY